MAGNHHARRAGRAAAHLLAGADTSRCPPGCRSSILIPIGLVLFAQAESLGGRTAPSPGITPPGADLRSGVPSFTTTRRSPIRRRREHPRHWCVQPQRYTASPHRQPQPRRRQRLADRRIRIAEHPRPDHGHTFDQDTLACRCWAHLVETTEVLLAPARCPVAPTPWAQAGVARPPPAGAIDRGTFLMVLPEFGTTRNSG